MAAEPVAAGPVAAVEMCCSQSYVFQWQPANFLALPGKAHELEWYFGIDSIMVCFVFRFRFSSV